jgi:HEAT repeat protein
VAAAEALGTIAAAESIEPLVAAYLDVETKVRQAALRALMRVDYRWHRNAQAYQTLPALKRALRSKDYSVRNAATELMERIFSIKRSSLRSQSGDPESARRSHAADLLITCLWEDDALLRGAAAEALGALRSNRARDALKVVAKDAHQWIRQQAVHALDLIENSRPSRESGWRPGSGA